MEQANNYYFIAVDFDGTLAKDCFPLIGARNEKGIQTLNYHKKKQQRLGKDTIVILWTCRTDRAEGNYLSEAVEWCKREGIHIDFVNENPLSPYGDWQRKLHSDIYIDDKAVNV